jgi:3-hydroxyacyl-CoA dehydrogenase
MANLVLRTDHGAIAVLTLNAPPVTALVPDTVAALTAAFAAALADDAVRGILLCGAGRGFASSPNVRRLDDGGPDAALTNLCLCLEDAAKPVLAALHGAVSGAGLELALACHYRVAQPGTRMSMPGVAVGQLPVAGGILRLVRVVGGPAALRILLDGRRMGARTAHRIGLFDSLAEDAVAAAILRAAQVSPRPTRKRMDALIHPDRDAAALAAARAGHAAEPPDTPAPAAIVDVVEAAIGAGSTQVQVIEARLAAACAASGPARALHHLSVARRLAAMAPPLPTPLPAVDSIAVAIQGAGAAALCIQALRAGLATTVLAPDDATLAAQLARVAAALQAEQAAGAITQAEQEAYLVTLSGSSDPAAAAHAEVLVAPDTDLADVIKPRGVCLLTAGVALGVRAMAVTGLLPRSGVLELRPGPDTGDDARATALRFAQIMGCPALMLPPKAPPVLDRLETAFYLSADHLLTLGITPGQIDAALRAAGWAQGPFERRGRATGAPTDAGALMSPDDIVAYVQDAVANRAMGMAGMVDSAALDLAAHHGLGWPRATGGPIWAAQEAGLGHMLDRLWTYGSADCAIGPPAPLLEEAVFRMRATLVP